MASATTALGYTLTNWGSVFTTYTPPASCTLPRYMFASSQNPDRAIWADRCSDDDCWDFPGSEEQKEAMSTHRLLYPYYSPGVECPTGWKSIGALARASDGPIASSGVFTVGFEESSDKVGDGIPYTPSLYDAYGAILDIGEELVACCPSSMTLGENGGCYSIPPVPSSRTFSTGCAAQFGGYEFELTSTTYVIGGRTTSGSLALLAEAMTEPGTLTTTTFSSGELSDWVVMTQAAPIYFVSATGGASTTPGADEPTETETDNAAAKTGYPGGGSSWGQVGAFGGVMAVSVLVGMVMVLPWGVC